MSWTKALLWGTVIVAVLFAVMYVAYFAVQYFLTISHP
jgi:hypothetical protein